MWKMNFWFTSAPWPLVDPLWQVGEWSMKSSHFSPLLGGMTNKIVKHQKM